MKSRFTSGKKFKTFLLVFLSLSSVNLFAQTWTEQTSPTTNILWGAWAVNSDIVWIGGIAGTVIKTTNGGQTWTSASGNLPGSVDLNTVSAINQNICIAGAMNGLWRTTDGGVTWNTIGLTPPADSIDVVHMFNANTGFVIADPVSGQWGYYITSDGGANWIAGANSPPAITGEYGYRSGYAALDTGHIWWGTNVSKIWKGSLRGPFTSYPTIGPISRAIAFNDTNTGVAIMYNINSNVNRTTDGGLSWNSGYYANYYTHSIKAVPGTGFMWIGGGLGQIFRSTNAGQTFQLQTLTGAGQVYAMTMVHQGLGWIGTVSGRIFKYTDPNFTGIENGNSGLPDKFNLGQNYPNPFNPTTKISFSIPRASNVKLVVFNVLGEEIATLLDEFKQAGNWEIKFNATNLPSGVYYYKLISDNFNQTKRMVLVK